MKPALLIGVVAVALGGAFGYYNVHVPQQQQVQVIQRQIADEQSSQRTKADIAGLLDEIQQFQHRLPQEPDPSWLVREAVALAEKSGLQLSLITREIPQPNKQLIRLSVALQFTASYHKLGTFLDALERSDAFIRVDRISVSPSPEKSDAMVQLVLSTVYVPPVVKTHPAMK